MKLRFLTVATEAAEKDGPRVIMESKGQAIVVLSDTPYFESLESAMKIRKYVKQKNVMQLPKSIQDIIRDQQEEANHFEASSMEELKRAIEKAAFYVDGERLELRKGDACARIDQALEYLVSHVYNYLGLITKNAETDADITALLTGADPSLQGMEPNRDAAAKVEEYLIVQDRKKLPTSMFDVQSRYQGIPYGWREIDIAAVVALLINQQKVTIKYGGATIQPNDPKLPDMLRKKSEIGKTSVSLKVSPDSGKLLTARQCVHCLSDRNLNTDFLVFIVIEYARFIHLIQQVSYCQAADNRDLTQALEPLILKKLLYHLFDCHKPSELDRTRFCDRRIILIGQDVKHLSKCDIRIQFGVLHLGYNTIHYDKRKIVEIRQCGYRLEART